MNKSLFFLCVLVSLTSLSSIAQDTVTAKEDLQVNKGTYSSSSTGNGLGNLILFGDGSNGGGWQSSIKWSGLDGFNYGTSSGIRVNAEITVGNVGAYGKSDLIFKTKGTNDNATPSEKFRITSLGNVGIGTNSPTAKLQITDQGNSSVTTLRLNNRIKFRGDGVTLWGQSGNQGILSWDTGRAIIGGQTSQHLSLYSNGSEKMRLDSNGNVGIGTTTPTQKLDVNGTVKVGDGNWGALIIDGKDKNDWLLNAHNGGDSFAIRTQRNNGENNWSFQVMTFQRSTGNIGIGTTTPDAKLAVNGDIHTKEVKVDLIGWADYVFKEDYNLPTLQQVEEHINTKGHLINIPSAAEVAENGILLGEMNAKLLEKIEELTLYTIAQEKKLKEQQTINNELQVQNKNFSKELENQTSRLYLLEEKLNQLINNK